MRSTNEIVIAVKDGQSVTEEELRLALISVSVTEMTYFQMLHELIQAIRDDTPTPLLKLKAELAWQTVEEHFAGHKKPVDKWLGPENIPGTPENNERQEWAKAVYKNATGKDIYQERRDESIQRHD